MYEIRSDMKGDLLRYIDSTLFRTVSGASLESKMAAIFLFVITVPTRSHVISQADLNLSIRMFDSVLDNRQTGCLFEATASFTTSRVHFLLHLRGASLIKYNHARDF